MHGLLVFLGACWLIIGGYLATTWGLWAAIISSNEFWSGLWAIVHFLIVMIVWPLFLWHVFGLTV